MSDPDTAITEDSSLHALRLALRDLRDEIRRGRGSAATLPDQSIRRDAMRQFEALRRRAGGLGIRERTGDVDAFGFDPAAVRAARPLLDFLMDRFWRIDLHGVEKLRRLAPAVLVANRSGLLPYDGLMLAHVLERRLPGAQGRARFLVGDELIRLPFVQPYLARLGGVRACRENADRLLRCGHSVIAFPEGDLGRTKVFADRYRLEGFGCAGAIRAAIDNEVPLVPVGIVGAEEAQPILLKADVPGLRDHVPFVPVTPTFPWLGPLGLMPMPTKWRIHIGEAIPLDGLDTAVLDEERLVSGVTDELRSRIEVLIRAGRARRRSMWT